MGDVAYERRHWWRVSEGVREVLGETIAYIYARFSSGLRIQCDTVDL